MRDNRLFVEAIEYKPMPITSTVEIACPKGSRDRLRLAPTRAAIGPLHDRYLCTRHLTSPKPPTSTPTASPRPELNSSQSACKHVERQINGRQNFPDAMPPALGHGILISASEHPASQASCNRPTSTAIPHVANTASQCFFCFGSSLLVRHF